MSEAKKSFERMRDKNGLAVKRSNSEAVQFPDSMKHFQLITAMALCTFGCIMLTAGFLCPPLAEIHHSVLVAFGEILTFSGSLIGIDYKYRYRE